MDVEMGIRNGKTANSFLVLYWICQVLDYTWEEMMGTPYIVLRKMVMVEEIRGLLTTKKERKETVGK